MERFEGYVFTAICSTNFLVSCLLFSKITREQREPYMDEIFHVPQAQQYCLGRFDQWDPMITTLPGLYLVAVGVIRPLAWLADLTGEVVCSTSMLRFINLLFNSGNLYLLHLLTCTLHPRQEGAVRRALAALALSSFPVLYFFSFLFYTDAGSTFFVLSSYLAALRGRHGAAAALGTAALLFRQTNIVWVAFCAGTLLAGRLDEAWHAELAKKSDERPAAAAGARRLAGFLLARLAAPARVRALLAGAWPYVAVGVGFVAFVALNDGVVVGDRGSHRARLHAPQLFYFLAFALVFSLPATAGRRRLLRFLRALRRRPLPFLCLLAAGLLLVWSCTHVHRYLLADNRHYTFYVWRRVVGRHAAAPYLLVPGYVFAGWHLLDALRRPPFWTLALAACVAAATVPQALLEFRYFIVPYLMVRLHLPPPALPRLLLELGLHAAVNAATLHLFLAHSFLWPGSDAPQRFMW